MTTFNDNYVSFQGKIYVSKRDASGNRGPFWFIGNAPKASLALSVDRNKHKESTSGNRLIDKVQTKQKSGQLSITLEDIQIKNLKLALAGGQQSLSGSYSGSNYDTFPTGLAIGDIVKLNYFNISSLVIKDSAGSPVTLALGTDYEIVSAKHGLVRILSLGSYTQPFKSQYAYAATTVITAFEGSDDDEFWVYCALINTEPSTDQAIGFEIPRNVFDPVKDLQLITEDQGSIELTSEVLRDSTLAENSAYGGFARWIYADANL